MRLLNLCGTAAALMLMVTASHAVTRTYTWNDNFFDDNQRRERWCLAYRIGCGKMAADRFCQLRNFASASQFQKALVLAPKRYLVRIPGTNLMRLETTFPPCNDDSCRTFQSITCVSGEKIKKARKTKKKR